MVLFPKKKEIYRHRTKLDEKYQHIDIGKNPISCIPTVYEYYSSEIISVFLSLYFCFTGGPPAAVISGSTNSLQCSCPHCPAGCTSYHWYHTQFNDPYARRKLSEYNEYITVEDEGQYSCRRECGNGFSRFSNSYSYKGTNTQTYMLFRLSLSYCFY